MISHRLKCIFVHIPKTAGTSIEFALFKDYERTPSNLWGFHRPEFCNKHQLGALQHLRATQIRQEVGTGDFDRYFKFAFVRNPWDRMVSLYAYLTQTDRMPRQRIRDFLGISQDISFKAFVGAISESEIHPHWEEQHKFVTDENGKLIVDFIGRYEDLHQGYAYICQRLPRLQKNPSLPWRLYSRRGCYWPYYDDETREMVAEMYKEDRKLFRYSFPKIYL
jgi:hypothetical protein